MAMFFFPAAEKFPAQIFSKIFQLAPKSDSKFPSQFFSRLRREFSSQIDEKHKIPLKNSAAGEKFPIFQYNFHDFHLKILKISACGGQILPKFPAWHPQKFPARALKFPAISQMKLQIKKTIVSVREFIDFEAHR